MQQQPFIGTQTASVPDLSTIALPPAKKWLPQKLPPAS
jgi:hypothetical protein